MGINSPKPRTNVLKHRVRRAISRMNAFLQTPFGATAGGGLVVVVIARLLFG
jgi:hypothetical protein